MTFTQIKTELQKIGNPEKAAHSAHFFKTAKGEYGEGDKFIGVTVPEQRKIAKKYIEISLTELSKLLKSPIHELRLTALTILTHKYEKTHEKRFYDFYFKHTKYINNWDLIDLSAPKIIGHYLLNKPQERKILYKFAKSKNLWERRIAMLSTYTFIKNIDFADALKIAEILVKDDHDLMHKAVGWMLREIGNRNQTIEEKFLKKHYKIMPRTMLRYAIEKFSKKKKEFYMKK